MNNQADIALMAHLMRRAGFGSTKEELQECLNNGYEQTVDNLLDSQKPDSLSDALIRRYHPDHSSNHDFGGAGSSLLYRLASTNDPLKEKIPLFWNNIFATGYAKVTNGKPLTDQFRMFREHGMGSLDTLLLEISRDPAMIIWLDNIDNRSGAVNENYGRELLELFSLGVGNYTEDDVKECSRAFTGWTVANADYIKQLAIRNSIWPYGKLAWRHEYIEQDHDDGPKTFLGETGNFSGEDVIGIICRHSATARFISRHMYHFFVADEPPVPQWPYKPPRDIEAIRVLETAYFESGHNIKHMLRVLFNSDFFKSEECRFEKIKSPTELVTGVLRLTREFEAPKIEIVDRNNQVTYMGQQLMNPPSVEGWHQGLEWIETGSLTERVNFASQQLSDIESVGVKRIIGNVINDENGYLTAQSYVDKCLDELGALQASAGTRDGLTQFANDNGLPDIDLSTDCNKAEDKLSKMLGVVGSMPEFQRS